MNPSASPHECRDNPFDLNNDPAYRAWRDRKLETYPSKLTDLVVEVNDPRALTPAEHEAVLQRCRKANMAIYASGTGNDPDRAIPLAMGRQFGLGMLDHNWLAGEDGLTALTVVEASPRNLYIPYTNRPIKWHTDGYYNTAHRQIRALLLHCVSSAARGGDNALLDHEVAYILLRDKDPDFIRALMKPDAMTIPARMEAGQVARAEEPGPVFSVHPESGDLHMRYTARTRSIYWKEDTATRNAAGYLQDLLNSDCPYIFRGRLEAGMGLVGNNVLHDRSGFSDDETHHRLLYRARYYDRLAGTGIAHTIV